MKKFISVDPSMRNTGVVLGEIEGSKITPMSYFLISTEKDKSAKVAQDTIKRCSKLIGQLRNIVESHSPDICFVELPSGSQSASAMKGYGVSCAIISQLPQDITYSVTPKELKKIATGIDKASKKDIINWAANNYPDFPFLKNSKGQIVITKMEHIADAIAAAYACIKKYELEL